MSYDDPTEIVFGNQVSTLLWLRDLGHKVVFSANPEPSSDGQQRYAARTLAIGRPCPYCAETMTRWGPRQVTRDHVLPRSRGGVRHERDGGQITLPNNILYVCWSCNNHKANNTLQEWHDRLHRAGDPRALIVLAVIKSTSESGEG